MELARKALAALLWLYVVGVVAQFFLAGLGMRELGDEGMRAHRAFGYAALYITPIIFLVLAAVGKMPKMTLVALAGFAIISIVQPFWASEFRGEALAALHVVGAAVILLGAQGLARMVTRQVRQGSA